MLSLSLHCRLTEAAAAVPLSGNVAVAVLASLWSFPIIITCNTLCGYTLDILKLIINNVFSERVIVRFIHFR